MFDSIFCFLLLAALPLVAQVSAPVTQASRPLTVEAIFAHGSLTGTVPEELRWSPDGKRLLYVDASADDGGELKEVEPATGQTHVLVSHEKLAAIFASKATETDRDHRDRYKLASYLWSPDSSQLLFDANGHLWLYDLTKKSAVEVASGAASGTTSGDDPKFSPNGEFVSMVRDHGLSVVRIPDRINDQDKAVLTIAPSDNPALLNGEVDWVYEEELGVRSNYFWSPDSRHIAFLKTDETLVPEYPITDWLPVRAEVEMQRYPQPGSANPVVHVGVASVDGGKIHWMKLSILEGQGYIPRFGWLDAGNLWIEWLSRDQKRCLLYFANAATGEAHTALEMTDKKFLNDHYDLAIGDGKIVMTNWSDGHTHLYLYNYDPAKLATATAKLERQLTHGDFEVSEVYRVDTAAGFVDYASNEGNVLEQQLWQVSFSGERRQLNSGAGYHDGYFAPTGDAFAEKFSTRTTPPTLSVCAAKEHCKSFWKSHAIAPYALQPLKWLEVKAKDGTLLHATLLLPEGKDAASIPLILNPYGEPGVQGITNRWSDGLFFDALLAERGFAVLHAENRGMAMRGRTFAQAAYHNFGAVQLEDQLTVLDAALAQYPQLDAKRLGWWGWSWGGTFTLYALSHSDRFRAGVAVAAVTNWRDYDSIYTERYLSQPSESPASYKDFSVNDSAAKLKGRLLLVHGTSDDNVHLENTMQYVQKLIEAGIAYDLQLYPGKTHSIAGAEAQRPSLQPHCGAL